MIKYYKKIRKTILEKFPFLRLLKKYKIIIPKIKAHVIWPIFKPKVITFDKKKFYLSHSQFSDPSRNLYAYGEIYEQEEKKIIKQFVRDSDNCIDVGANIGFYTWQFLKNSSFQGNIYSFECLKEVYQILEKNFLDFQNVKIYNGYVGSDESKNFLVPDKLIKEKISFIKIDIDGPDYNALKGCENLIDEFSPKIIIELCENSFENWNIHYSEIINFLKNKKYKCYEIKNLNEEFNRSLYKNEVINIFAIK